MQILFIGVVPKHCLLELILFGSQLNFTDPISFYYPVSFFFRVSQECLSAFVLVLGLHSVICILLPTLPSLTPP